MKTGFVCPVHENFVAEGACPWCEPLTTEAPAPELESKDALEALRVLFRHTNVAGTAAPPATTWTWIGKAKP